MWSFADPIDTRHAAKWLSSLRVAIGNETDFDALMKDVGGAEGTIPEKCSRVDANICAFLFELSGIQTHTALQFSMTLTSLLLHGGFSCRKSSLTRLPKAASAVVS